MNRFFHVLSCAVLCCCALVAFFIAIATIHVQPLQWEQTNGPYGVNVYSFTVIGTTVIASTEGGIFRSTDNGVSWTSVKMGMVNPGVGSLAVSGAMLYASTNRQCH